MCLNNNMHGLVWKFSSYGDWLVWEDVVTSKGSNYMTNHKEKAKWTAANATSDHVKPPLSRRTSQLTLDRTSPAPWCLCEPVRTTFTPWKSIVLLNGAFLVLDVVIGYCTRQVMLWVRHYPCRNARKPPACCKRCLSGRGCHQSHWTTPLTLG